MRKSTIKSVDVKNVVAVFMNVFNENNKCSRDSYDRPTATVNISTSEFNQLSSELISRINGLTVLRDDNYIVTYKYYDCEVNMEYIAHTSGTMLTFTKLSYLGDIRDFDD